MGDADNSKKQRGKPFQKGTSGNPAGRPAGYAEFKAKCRERTEAALRALEEALADDSSRVAAAKVLLEFGWGKATQAVEVSGPEGEPFRLVIHDGGK